LSWLSIVVCVSNWLIILVSFRLTLPFRVDHG